MATDGFDTYHEEYLEKQRQKVKESPSEEHVERLTTFIHSRHKTLNIILSIKQNAYTNFA